MAQASNDVNPNAVVVALDDNLHDVPQEPVNHDNQAAQPNAVLDPGKNVSTNHDIFGLPSFVSFNFCPFACRVFYT